MPKLSENQKRIDTLQSIELADGVEVHSRVAGVFPRAMAHFIDFIVILVLWAVLLLLYFIIITRIGQFESLANVSQGVFLLLTFIFMWFYFYLFERGKKAATPGKRIVGLKVVSADGTKVSEKQVLIRNLLRAADIMPGFIVKAVGLMIGTYGVGLLSVLFTERFQRIGDLVASTIVIYDKQPSHIGAALEVEQSSKIPRVKLTREEEVAIRSFADRAGIWSQARREEMAQHAFELTGQNGEHGCTELMAYAKWIGERK